MTITWYVFAPLPEVKCLFLLRSVLLIYWRLHGLCQPLLCFAFCDGGVKAKAFSFWFPYCTIKACTWSDTLNQHAAGTGPRAEHPGKENRIPWQCSCKSQGCLPWSPASNLIVSSMHPRMCRGLWEDSYICHEVTTGFRFQDLDTQSWFSACYSGRIMATHTTPRHDILVTDLSA